MAMRSASRKIWIDLDNSPHVPFFVPIIEELRVRGFSVVVTARNCCQVFELVDLYGLKCKRIGHHYGKSKLLKVVGLCARASQLMPTILHERPDLALSHGSRSQLLLSKLIGIPSAVVMDYEHVKGLKLMRPNWTIIPDIISTAAMASRANRILTYPGIKEDVYAHQFIPDATFRTNLGLTEQNLIVTIRPPAEEAHYHNPESEALLGAVMRLMGNTPATKMIMLPRNQKQEKSIRRLWPELFATNKAVIPEHAVDGLNLIWHSDLVVSGGGTMNREAAALGVPVYSIFRGKIGAVDRYLASNNRLTLLESVKDVRTKLVLERRVRLSRPERANSRALSTIVEHISSVVETSSAKRMNGRNKSTAVRTAD